MISLQGSVKRLLCANNRQLHRPTYVNNALQYIEKGGNAAYLDTYVVQHLAKCCYGMKSPPDTCHSDQTEGHRKRNLSRRWHHRGNQFHLGYTLVFLCRKFCPRLAQGHRQAVERVVMIVRIVRILPLTLRIHIEHRNVSSSHNTDRSQATSPIRYTTHR